MPISPVDSDGTLIAENLIITGELSIAQSLVVTESMTLAGDLTISGDLFVDGTFENVALLQKSGGVMTGTLTLAGDPTVALHAATKQYVDSETIGLMPAVNAQITAQLAVALPAKQSVLVSGTNIKTINSTSLLGSGDIVIASGGGVTALAKGSIVLSQYFPEISWPSTNTQTYGWIIQRTYNVATGVAQFGLVQGGYRDTASGGCKGTILPFQIAANNTLTYGTPTTMWTNSSSSYDLSTCSLMTDNKSGGFHYSGNIPWPGNSGHTMGWGTGLLGENNTASTFSNSGTTTSQGIHDHNGQYFGLPDSDGWGWYGCNNGYSQSDSQTRIHSINYLNPSSPSIEVQNPSANTSTSPVMQFILQDNSTSANTAISGSCHWRNGSSQIIARVFSPTGSYTDHNSSANWNAGYSASLYYGVALSNGKVLVYHGSQVWLYTAHNNRTQVTATIPIDDPGWRGSCFLPDGTDSWIVLSSASSVAPFLQKWTINPTTYVWTQNWEADSPLTIGTSSYMHLRALPNGRFMLLERQGSGVAKWWIFSRSAFPV